MVFEFDDYYPGGGLCDVVYSSDDKEEALRYIKKDKGYENRQLFDRVAGIELDNKRS